MLLTDLRVDGAIELEAEARAATMFWECEDILTKLQDKKADDDEKN